MRIGSVAMLELRRIQVGSRDAVWIDRLHQVGMRISCLQNPDDNNRTGYRMNLRSAATYLNIIEHSIIGALAILGEPQSLEYDRVAKI
ncbi:MAG TPA: hypothetical protein VGC14_17030 [Rhizobium sp.]